MLLHTIMKLNSLVPSSFLILALAAAAPLGAQHKHDGHGDRKAAAPAATETEIIAKARASYPLKTCLVSDEPLGSMGEATPYIHRVAGKPDRVIFVCCEGCIDDFKGDPAKFLKKVDDAAAKAAKSAPAKKS